MGPSLSLSRVLCLCGGLALIAAFFMPWFSSQGLLLSGQFLHAFLATASPSQLRQFLPSSTAQEVSALRLLVDLFPTAGALAALAALLGGVLPRARRICNMVLGAGGLVSLLAWAVGITRLPSGAAPEIGLWLIALGSVAILIGLVLDLTANRVPVEVSPSV